MQALVVFESMFGNTRQVAEAIGEGLSVQVAADLVEVNDAPRGGSPLMSGWSSSVDPRMRSG